MTYLEKWFDYNRHQKEMEALLEETIAQQSEQRLNLKEFYLLYYLDLADEKSLRQIDLPDKLHLSPSAVSRMVARLEEKNCGLLSRRCCDQDRRASFICLTDEGQTTSCLSLVSQADKASPSILIATSATKQTTVFLFQAGHHSRNSARTEMEFIG